MQSSGDPCELDTHSLQCAYKNCYIHMQQRIS